MSKRVCTPEKLKEYRIKVDRQRPTASSHTTLHLTVDELDALLNTIDSHKQGEEDNAAELCQIEKALVGVRDDEWWEVKTDKLMERIRDLIAKEGELGDAKERIAALEHRAGYARHRDECGSLISIITCTGLSECRMCSGEWCNVHSPYTPCDCDLFDRHKKFGQKCTCGLDEVQKGGA